MRLSLAADLSQISESFLTQAQFIAKPSVPDDSERQDLMLMIILGAMLSTLFAVVFVWLRLIIKTLLQDDANKA